VYASPGVGLEIAVALGEPRIELDDLIDRLERVRGPALPEQERAARAERTRVLRCEPNRFVDLGVCLGPSLGVGVLRHPEQPLDDVL